MSNIEITRQREDKIKGSSQVILPPLLDLIFTLMTLILTAYLFAYAIIYILSNHSCCIGPQQHQFLDYLLGQMSFSLHEICSLLISVLFARHIETIKKTHIFLAVCCVCSIIKYCVQETLNIGLQTIRDIYDLIE